MTRRTFVLPSGFNVGRLDTVTVCTDVACTVAADIQTVAGVAIAGGVLTARSDGYFMTGRHILGPDNVVTLYAKMTTDNVVRTLTAVDEGGTDERTQAEADAFLSVLSGTYGLIGGSSAFLGASALVTVGHESFSIGVLADSTSNDIDEWVYLCALAIAAKYPALSVRHYVWNDVTQDYAVPTAIQTGTAGVQYLNCPASLGWASFPRGGTGLVQIATDLDVRVKAQMVDWTPGTTQTFAAHWGNAGERSWAFHVNATTGILQLMTSVDGTASTLFLNSTVAPTIADGADLWVRVVLDVDNGAAGNTATFYTSTDGVTWTVLGSPRVTAGTTSLFASPYTYEIGSRTGGAEVLIGKIYEVEIRNGIAGDAVVPRWVDQWTLVGNGTIVGAPVLAFLNGSQSGADIAYLTDATRLPKISPKGWQTSLIVLSCSHNDADKRGGSSYLPIWDAWLTALRARHAYAGIALTTQNPETLPNVTYRFHEARRRELMQWAANNRVSVIDAYGAFLTDGRAMSLLVDPVLGIHPTPAGSLLWSAKVMQALGV